MSAIRQRSVIETCFVLATSIHRRGSNFLPRRPAGGGRQWRSGSPNAQERWG